MVSTRSHKKEKQNFSPTQSPTRPPRRSTRNSVRNSMSVSEEASQSPLPTLGHRRMGERTRNLGWLVSAEENDEDGDGRKGSVGIDEEEGLSVGNNRRSDGLASTERNEEASDRDTGAGVLGQVPNKELNEVVLADSAIRSSLDSEGGEDRHEDTASDPGKVKSNEEDAPKRIKKEPLSDESSGEREKPESAGPDDFKNILSHVQDEVVGDGRKDTRNHSEDSSISDQSTRTILSPDMELGNRSRNRAHDDADDENKGEVKRLSYDVNQSKDHTRDQGSDVDQVPEEDASPSQEEIDEYFQSHFDDVNEYRSQHENQDQTSSHRHRQDEDVTQPIHQRHRPIYAGRVLSPIPGASSSVFQHSCIGKNRATSSQPETVDRLSQLRQKRRNNNPPRPHISHQEQQWQAQNEENDPTADPAESLVLCRVQHQSALEEIERLNQDVEVANQQRRGAYERLEMEMAESKIANDEVTELRAIQRNMVHELATANREMEALEKENQKLRDVSGRFSSQLGRGEAPTKKGNRAGDEDDLKRLGKEEGNDLLMKKRRDRELEDLGQTEKERIRALEKELEQEKQRKRRLEDDLKRLIDEHVRLAKKLLGPSAGNSREA